MVRICNAEDSVVREQTANAALSNDEVEGSAIDWVTD
jgi:hypothetical protein